MGTSCASDTRIGSDGVTRPSGGSAARRCTAAGVGLAAGLAGALSLVSTRGGPRLTEDSSNYLAMAAGLVRDGTLVGVSGRPVTVFPAGFPVSIALGELLGFDGSGRGEQTWIRLLLASSAVVTAWSAGAIVARRVVDRRWAVFAAAATAVSPALVLVWSSAWSDGPFVAALSLFLVAVDALWRGRSVGDRPSPGWIALAVAAGWAAVSLRYVGVVTVPVLVVVVCCTRPARRSVSGWFVGAAACAVPLVLLARNLAVDGSVAGGRSGGGRPVAEAVVTATETLGGWIAPGLAPLGLLIVAIVVALVVLGGRSHLLGEVATDLAPLLAIAALVLGFVAASDLMTSVDGLDDRLLSGMVLPCVVFVSVLGDHVRGVDPAPQGSAAGGLGRVVRPGRAAVIGAALWAVLVVPSSVALVVDPALSFTGFRDRPRELVSLARRLPADSAVVSNAPERLWLSSDLVAVAPMPTTGPRGWEPADPAGTELRRLLRCAGGSVHLIWFDDAPGTAVEPAQLGPDVRSEVLDEVEGGSLWRLTLEEGLTGSRSAHATSSCTAERIGTG